MNKTALVCVLLSTYNGKKYLKEQLDSLLLQSHKSLRIVIRDDGSTDGTQDLIRSYEERDSRFVCHYGANIGVVRSFSELARNAPEADYYAFCDQDDIWQIDKISRALDYLAKEDANLPLLYCSALVVSDETGQPLFLSKVPSEITFGSCLVENFVTGCTSVINREAMQLIRGNLNYDFCMHDWWCALLVSAFGKVVVDRDSRINYRQHASNVVGLNAGVVKRVKTGLQLLFRGEDRFNRYAQVESILEVLSRSNRARDKEIVCRRLLESRGSFLTRLRLVVTRDISWYLLPKGAARLLRYALLGRLD